MKVSRYPRIIRMGFVALFCHSLLFAGSDEAPPKVIAALLIKLIPFEKNISGSSQDITIFVLGAPAVANELQAGVGKSLGKAKLARIDQGDELPAEKPAVLYVGDPAKVSEATQYSRTNKILSITGIPELVNKGVSLGIGVEGGKPKILLNLSTSVSEGLDWNPAIMKVATTIK